MLCTTPPILSGLIKDKVICCILRVRRKAPWIILLKCCFLCSCGGSGETTDDLTCNQDILLYNKYMEIHQIKLMKQAHTHISSHIHSLVYTHPCSIKKNCGDITLTSIHPLISNLSLNPHLLTLILNEPNPPYTTFLWLFLSYKNACISTCTHLNKKYVLSM